LYFLLINTSKLKHNSFPFLIIVLCKFIITVIFLTRSRQIIVYFNIGTVPTNRVNGIEHGKCDILSHAFEA